MRVFIALEMPDEVKKKLCPCLKWLAQEYRGVKWVAVQHLHLTLMFLGDVSLGQMADLDGALASITKGSAPFFLTFTQVGTFGRADQPHAIWLGIKNHEPLSSLAEQVASASAGIVSLIDRKPFRPHITLGRVRHPYAGPALQVAIERVDGLVLPVWSVGALSVIKSELTSKGPIYTTLSRHQLGGS